MITATPALSSAPSSVVPSDVMIVLPLSSASTGESAPTRPRISVLKEKLYEENQIDHTDLLAAMTSQERYLSNREELLAQMEMLKVNIDTLIGKCEEE